METTEEILNLDEDTGDEGENPHLMHEQSKLGISPGSPGKTSDNIPCENVPCNVPCDHIPCDNVPCDDIPCDDVPCDDIPCDDVPSDDPTDNNSPICSIEAPTPEVMQGAPNRFVNFENLKSTVESELGPCKHCKNKERSLVQTQNVGFASTFEIYCQPCTSEKEQKRLELVYLNRKLEKAEPIKKKEKDEYRKQSLKKNNKQRFYNKVILPRRENRLIRPKQNKKISLRKRILTLEKGKHAILDYEINIRAILAAFYCGTGPDGTARNNAFMGVPGCKSWERSCHNHSSKVTKLIRSVVDKVIDNALREEITASIRLKLEHLSDEEKNKAITAYFNKDKDNIPDAIKKIGLIFSYDMGWQKRSTGKIYDSLSGHAFIIGAITGKVIGYKVKSKSCSKCKTANTLDIDAEEHDCQINFDGSSGAMEAAVALELCIQLHDGEYDVYVEKIVSDDDSTMRAHLRHVSQGGKLPDRIPPPIFLADPSHRIKVMAKPLFKMAKSESKDPERCKKIDALRLKKYIGCWIYQNRNLPIEEFMAKTSAPVEHLFNCHEWCDHQWCWAKELELKKMELVTANKTSEKDAAPPPSPSSPPPPSSPPTSPPPPPSPPPTDDPDDNDDELESDSTDDDLHNSDGDDFKTDDELSESDDDDELELDENEIEENKFFQNLDGTHVCDNTIFTTENLQALKEREIAMIQRNERGYYRCKVTHEKLHTDITHEMKRFFSREMLLQLNHPYSTQSNEAGNNSVAALAQKGKHYSSTDSLRTRVGIAGGCQIVGHATFWTMVLNAFDIEMDDGLKAFLDQRDSHKAKKNIRQGSIEGKRKRSTKKNEKLNREKQEFIDGHKAGMEYKTGVAVAAAKKNLPSASDRNPKGTPKDQMRCPYWHPSFCTVRGHSKCNNKDCAMRSKTKEEREAAKQFILNELVQNEILGLCSKSKRFFFFFVRYFVLT